LIFGKDTFKVLFQIFSYFNSNIKHLTFSPDGNKSLLKAGDSFDDLSGLELVELSELLFLAERWRNGEENRGFFGEGLLQSAKCMDIISE